MCGRFALDRDASELPDLLASQLRRNHQREAEEEDEEDEDDLNHQQGEQEDQQRSPIASGSGTRNGEAPSERNARGEGEENASGAGPSQGGAASSSSAATDEVPRLSWSNDKVGEKFKKRFNIAPQTFCIVLRAADSNDGSYILEPMKWGLIPFWTKRPPTKPLQTINCRDDTLFSGTGMWNAIRGRKRCVVIAAGFYEWLTKGTTKVPHFVKPLHGKLMLMAGLWDEVTYTGEIESMKTFTIITTSSNSQLSFLHDRMPALLTTPAAVETWLSPTPDHKWTSELQALVKPFEGKLECYTVPPEVGKVGVESSDFVKPVAERKGNIASLFAAQARSQSSSPEKPKSKLSPSSSPPSKPTTKPCPPSTSTASKPLSSKSSKPSTVVSSKAKPKVTPKVEEKAKSKEKLAPIFSGKSGSSGTTKKRERERDSSIEIIEDAPSSEVNKKKRVA